MSVCLITAREAVGARGCPRQRRGSARGSPIGTAVHTAGTARVGTAIAR